jgi:hypothetical protein
MGTGGVWTEERTITYGEHELVERWLFLATVILSEFILVRHAIGLIPEIWTPYSRELGSFITRVFRPHRPSGFQTYLALLDINPFKAWREIRNYVFRNKLISELIETCFSAKWIRSAMLTPSFPSTRDWDRHSLCRMMRINRWIRPHQQRSEIKTNLKISSGTPSGSVCQCWELGLLSWWSQIRSESFSNWETSECRWMTCSRDLPVSFGGHSCLRVDIMVTEISCQIIDPDLVHSSNLQNWRVSRRSRADDGYPDGILILFIAVWETDI